MPSSYEGRDITIHFDGRRCIHARRCVLGQPEVFTADGGRGWIVPDAASADAVIEIAHNCPSGAITYSLPDGTGEAPPRVNTIRITENGPYMVHAEIEIAGEPPRTRAVLCRCGASKRKPFCDNAHIASGFTATGQPEQREDAVIEARDGPLTVTPQENGPLKVAGNMELIAGSGRRVKLANEVWLCRCGHSANKPFCDSSHKRVGFEAEGE